MSHWIIVPVVLPALMAPFIVLVARYDIVLQRVFGIAATVVLLAVATGLYWLAGDGAIRPYQLGNWPAPFGIVLVLDRLSALMLLLTAILAVVVAVYAAQGWDRRGRHFHAVAHHLGGGGGIAGHRQHVDPKRGEAGDGQAEHHVIVDVQHVGAQTFVDGHARAGRTLRIPVFELSHEVIPDTFPICGAPKRQINREYAPWQ